MTDRLRLRVTASSDRGLVRGNNEDSAFGGAYLLALADGMGGHAAGEVASQLMIDRLSRLNQNPEDNDMLALLGASARDANVDIARHVEAHPETEGMGTTLTAMMFNGQQFGVIHAGDSRAYRLRDGKLEQITKDDTFVQSLVDKGRLSPDDVSSHPQKSLILKAYTGRDVEPTLFALDAQPGDRLLLCSDGLSDPVTASTIETALGQGTIESAAQSLVELALRSGGPDNVTVVVAEVTTADSHTTPAEPVYTGAIAGECPEAIRPDSSASRAAKLNRTPQIIPPSVPSTTQKTMELSGEETADEEDPERAPRKPGLGAVVAILAILAVTIAGGVGTKHLMSSRYFVAQSGPDKELVIEQGIELSVLGKDLHHPYQLACLNQDGQLRIKTSACEQDARPFRVTDLAPTDRQVVDNLDPGSNDQVQSQLVQLADKVLPVCRTQSSTAAKSADTPVTPTASNKAKASASATASASASAASTATASAAASGRASARAGASGTAASSAATTTPRASAHKESSAQKFRAEPGINCREAK